MIIVSGGQTGADRAALDAALALGLTCRGFVPRGGWAEDRPRPPGLCADYPFLRETPERSPAVRMRLNVRDAEATLILWPFPGQRLSRGAGLTLAACRQLGRPSLVVDPADPQALATARAWLAGLGSIEALNVAGPRESQAPGLYRAARGFLEALLA